MQLLFSHTQLALDLLLLAWLVACTVYDLRSRIVPVFLTLPILSLAMVWRLAQGGWPVVLLVAALILSSDLRNATWRIPLGCLAGALAMMVSGDLQSVAASLAVLAEWMLWEIGATGGADAKIILTLLLTSGDACLLIWVVLAGGLQGFIALLARRKSIPYTVAITLGTIFWFFVQVFWLRALS